MTSIPLAALSSGQHDAHREMWTSTPDATLDVLAVPDVRCF
jgi:hypothetical protein